MKEELFLEPVKRWTLLCVQHEWFLWSLLVTVGHDGTQQDTVNAPLNTAVHIVMLFVVVIDGGVCEVG